MSSTRLKQSIKLPMIAILNAVPIAVKTTKVVIVTIGASLLAPLPVFRNCFLDCSSLDAFNPIIVVVVVKFPSNPQAPANRQPQHLPGMISLS